MLRVVVFHYDQAVREGIVKALRHAGSVTYEANDPVQAWEAIQTFKPNAVITDFPAILDRSRKHLNTLTEAIRTSEEFSNIPIISLTEDDEYGQRDATAAGVSASLPASAPPNLVLQTIEELASRS